MKGGKLILLGVVCTLLVVGIVIGVIVGLNNHNYSSSSSSGSSSADGEVEDNAALAFTSKAVASVCSRAEHKKLCVESLSSLANNQSATPKDFLLAVLQVTVDELEAAIPKSQAIGNAAVPRDSLNKMAIGDCKELLEYALDDLEKSLLSIRDSNLHTLADIEPELNNWLSSVLSHQQFCLDGFDQPDLKDAMSNGLLNATILAENAISISARISQILTAFNIAPPPSPKRDRRLLSDVDRGYASFGFPDWFSSMDRRLLLTQNTPQQSLPPNAVVAKDGSGQYKTIAKALAAYPKKGLAPGERYVIYVKQGLYEEYVRVQRDQINVLMYGDGPEKTIITGDRANTTGCSTFNSSTFMPLGDGFVCKSMGFRNTAGPEKYQAVALLVDSDRSVFYDCSMDGFQDTLCVVGRQQFYRDCVISGTVDFIFGNAKAIIQNSLIIVKKPMDNQQNIVTAQGRNQIDEQTGLIIQNCTIDPHPTLYPLRLKIPTFLGRPWKPFSRTVIIETTLSDFIHSAGWMPWSGDKHLATLYYAEYGNRGPGADTTKRVTWKGYHLINRDEALNNFAVGSQFFINGESWIKFSDTPFFPGLTS